MPNPVDDEDLYKTILVGDRPAPGAVTITGHDRPRNWQTASSKGTEGGTSKLNGSDVGKFKTSHYLTRDFDTDEGTDDFELWDDFQRYIDSLTEGNAPKVVQIYHPDLARQRFTEVSVEKVYGIVHDGRGGATVAIDWIEYRPPKPKKVKSAKDFPNDPAKPAKPDPNAAKKAELQSLLDEAKTPL